MFVAFTFSILVSNFKSFGCTNFKLCITSYIRWLPVSMIKYRLLLVDYSQSDAHFSGLAGKHVFFQLTYAALPFVTYQWLNSYYCLATNLPCHSSGKKAMAGFLFHLEAFVYQGFNAQIFSNPPFFPSKFFQADFQGFDGDFVNGRGKGSLEPKRNERKSLSWNSQIQTFIFSLHTSIGWTLL